MCLAKILLSVGQGEDEYWRKAQSVPQVGYSENDGLEAGDSWKGKSAWLGIPSLNAHNSLALVCSFKQCGKNRVQLS